MPQSSAIDPELAKNLKSVLEKQGRTAYSVATALGVSPNWLYRVLNMNRGIMLPKIREVAAELGVSVGELVDPPSNSSSSLTDTPTPVDDRVREAEERAGEIEAELRRTEEERDRLRAQVAADSKSVPLEVVSGGLAEGEAREHPRLRLVPDLDVEAAAGAEAYVEQEPIVGHLAFREEWLTRTCVDPEQCRSIRVRGRSMEPTIQARARILVDTQRTRRLHDHIYVVRTGDGLVVKRLAREGDGWLLVSDNEDQEAYPPIPWPEEAVVRGQVMWTGKML